MTQADPPALPRGRGTQTALVGAALVAAVAYLGWRVVELESTLSERMTALTNTVDRSGKTVELLLLEARTDLPGPKAIVQQIEHWSPKLVSSSTNAQMAHDIRERLQRTLDAAETLGGDVFDELEAAYADAGDAETRRWILAACRKADPKRGIALSIDVIRGTRHSPDPQTRLRVANDLIKIDKRAAGEAIRTVLELESHRGLVRRVPTQLAKSYEQYIRTSQFPMFFHFIDAFARTEHEEVERVFLQLLKRDDHDKMTYQEVVEQLGKLGAHDAVARIERLFSKPPFGYADPIFQNHCLQALADIQGEGAVPFFEKQLQQPQQEIVVTKLQDLIKSLGPR